MASMLTVGVIIIYVVVAIAGDTLFFRKRKRLWRLGFHSILAFITFNLLFGVTIVVGITGGDDFLVFFPVAVGVILFGSICIYFSWIFNDWRTRKLREKYSKLPDSPQKEQLLKLLDKIESPDNKERRRD